MQHYRPDRFFTLAQQQRIQDLTRRWRVARDGGATLSQTEQAELEALADAEVRAAADRAAALAHELGR